MLWKILEKNNEFNEWLKDFNKASRYWEYKAEKAGKKSIDELAEYYHWLGFIDKFNKVDSCLQWLYDTNEKLTARADSGSVWAMNQLAIQYNKKGAHDPETLPQPPLLLDMQCAEHVFGYETRIVGSSFP